MSTSDLSSSTQNYLKAIWSLGEWSDEPVTASSLATRTGVRLSTASDAVRKLTEQGLADHAPYGAVTLTSRGQMHALTMVRRHRLIEAFLVDVLDYRWDQVHDEAESLEHAVSDFLIERLDEYLGHPRRDPHGDPIPAADGSLTRPAAIRLSEASPGGKVRVERISDADPELLAFLADHGIGVGTEIGIDAGSPFSDVLTVRREDRDGLPLGRSATDAMWVSLLAPGSESSAAG